MIKISLSATNPDACLEVYATPSETQKPAVLIFPGGAYHFLSDCERLPIVNYYAAQGFQPFVLMYSIGDKASYPAPLLEGSKAVWEIRHNCMKYCVDPDKITLVGFSAGAHVATMLATLWHTEASRAGTDIPYGGNKPNATVTGYTPTTFEDFFKKPTADIEAAGGGVSNGPMNLLGAAGSGFEEYTSLTTHNFVTDKTPPTFLWKTSSDFPSSSTEYARACKENGVPCELHIFDDSNRCAAMEFDPSLAVQLNDAFAANTQLWPLLSVNWLKRLYHL